MMKQEEVTKILTELYKIREMLGYDLTDLSGEAVDSALKTQDHVREIRKNLSTLAAAISALVLESESGDLAVMERNNVERIKAYAKKLGNMQYSLNEINKRYDKISELLNELAEMGVNMGEEIFQLQDGAREITEVFQGLGYEIPKSDLDSLLNTFRHPVESNDQSNLNIKTE